MCIHRGNFQEAHTWRKQLLSKGKLAAERRGQRVIVMAIHRTETFIGGDVEVFTSSTTHKLLSITSAGRGKSIEDRGCGQ